MKLPRNAKIFRGQLDLAPLAGVLFLVIIFLVLESSLVFTPGVEVRLPEAGEVPGIPGPAVSVVVDSQGGYFFDNRRMDPSELSRELIRATEVFTEPLTLVIQADRSVTYESVVELTLLARSAGIQRILQATRPQ